jgi:hypothetical protein
MDMAQGVDEMNMEVTQRHVRNGQGAGAKEAAWLDQLKEQLVDHYGFRPSQVRHLDWNKWGPYCANGLSPEEACMAEFFRG